MFIQVVLRLQLLWSLPITVVRCDSNKTGWSPDQPDFTILFLAVKQTDSSQSIW